MFTEMALFDNLNSSECLIRFDSSDLKMFANQIAANLIAASKSYPVGVNPYPKDDPVGGILVQRMNWASHGFINALQTEAKFLYLLVEYAVKRARLPFTMERTEATLITDALNAYQEWKTELCRAEQEEMGEHWGTATGFFKANWAEHNKAFLALWSR